MMKKNSRKEKKRRKNSQSIKQKTALWYTYLYLVIALVAVVVLSISLLKATYKEAYNESSKINSTVTTMLKNGRFEDKNYIVTNIEQIEKKYKQSIISIINTNGDYYLLEKNDDIET